jgi:hypothetical protein
MRATILVAALGSAAAVPLERQPSFTPATILADGKLAFQYAKAKITTKPGCGWTRGTYMIGLWDYYNASSDPDAKSFIQDWGRHYQYKLCLKGDVEPSHLRRRRRRRLQGPCEGDTLPCKGVHNANNQLCGATYAEMYMNMGGDKSMLADTEKILGEEIADAPDSNNFWSCECCPS